jgi:predicted ATP-dependent endonuclease of OLD family
MRLKRLWIDGFKNLNDFELDFTDTDGVTVLIGNNGSGKSNVLEAISAIFADLYRNGRQIDFSYKIEFFLEDNLIAINVVFENNNRDYYFVKYDNNQNNFQPIENIEQFLPSKLIMIYSGEDKKVYKKYYEYFKNKFQRDARSRIPNLPKMLYIDSFFWTISLLVLLKSDLRDNIDFCKKVLKNNNLENIKIKFTFNLNEINNSQSFLNTIADEEEKTYTLEKFKNIDIIPNEKDLFVQLSGMVGQKNKIKKLAIINNEIDTIYLSEGEKSKF